MITADQELMLEMLDLIKRQKEWIDAVPQETVLPAMPGFDGDWAATIIGQATERATEIKEGRFK